MKSEIDTLLHLSRQFRQRADMFDSLLAQRERIDNQLRDYVQKLENNDAIQPEVYMGASDPPDPPEPASEPASVPATDRVVHTESKRVKRTSRIDPHIIISALTDRLQDGEKIWNAIEGLPNAPSSISSLLNYMTQLSKYNLVFPNNPKAGTRWKLFPVNKNLKVCTAAEDRILQLLKQQSRTKDVLVSTLYAGMGKRTPSQAIFDMMWESLKRKKLITCRMSGKNRIWEAVHTEDSELQTTMDFGLVIAKP